MSLLNDEDDDVDLQLRPEESLQAVALDRDPQKLPPPSSLSFKNKPSPYTNCQQTMKAMQHSSSSNLHQQRHHIEN